MKSTSPEIVDRLGFGGRQRLSLDRQHGRSARRVASESDWAGTVPLTKLYVGNALFYAHKLDRNLFFEKVEKDESGNTLQRETFGNVAETIGARIEAEESA
jgi:hypothetical protein